MNEHTATDYRVVEDTDRDELRKQIREYIEHGWRLQGGISVCFRVVEPHSGALVGEDEWTYCQAMVK